MYKLFIVLFLYLIVECILIPIGVFQMKSKEPVALYTFEKDLQRKEISDVKMFNKKHGTTTILCSFVILPFWIIGYIFEDSIWSILLFLGGIIIPFICIAAVHKYLIKRYKIK